MSPVLKLLGRKLRLGVIGGGPGSFIGETHRQAARFDDQYEIVAGVLSSDPEISQKTGVQIGLAPSRSYKTVQELLASESKRDDGIDVVAIMTPNDTHFPYAMAALQNGLDVICDKPMTNTLGEAETLHLEVQKTGLVFCLTHNYSGYAMVRQAREMIATGLLGPIRLFQVAYVHGRKADESQPDSEKSWHYDPKRGGLSVVLEQIGCHAHHLLRFISGLEVAEVSADVGAIVPGRKIHDYAGASIRLENGARGSFWVTQAAAGVENDLRIRVSGKKGTLDWVQENPQVLVFKPIDAPAQLITTGGLGLFPLAKRATRLVAGHPDGFSVAFANIYIDAAEAIAARRSGKKPNPLSLYFPNSYDGLAGMRFINSMVLSSNADGKWTSC